MTESSFWADVVRPRLGAFGVVRRVENRLDAGTPDACYCLRWPGGDAGSGWIELKHAYAWPVRDDTPLRFNHFNLDQVMWMEEWAQSGGRCCLLAQVGRDYVLVAPERVRAVFDGLPRPDLLAAAAVHEHDAFPTGRVLHYLVGRK